MGINKVITLRYRNLKSNTFYAEEPFIMVVGCRSVSLWSVTARPGRVRVSKLLRLPKRADEPLSVFTFILLLWPLILPR